MGIEVQCGMASGSIFVVACEIKSTHGEDCVWICAYTCVAGGWV